MTRHLLQKIIFGSKSNAIAYQVTANGQLIINCLSLEQRKKEINISEEKYFTNPQELLQTGSKKSGCILILNNEHVLTKVVNSTTYNNSTNLFEIAFPNIKQEDFYLNAWNTPVGTMISICRKAYVSSVLEHYKNNNIHIKKIVLGDNSIANLIPFMGNGSYNSTLFHIGITDHKVHTLEKTANSTREIYNINGITVEHNSLSALGACLEDYISTDTYITSNELNELNNTLHKVYAQECIFQKGIKMAIGTILSILLINFFIFNHYFTKVTDIEQNAQINRSTKEKLTQLDTKVTEVQQIVENLLSNNTSRSSHYIDALVHSIPNTISLTEINFQPLEKKIQHKEAILITPNKLLLTGESTNSYEFSIWVEHLESYSWIRKVTASSYSDTAKNKSSFSLTIAINDTKK